MSRYLNSPNKLHFSVFFFFFLISELQGYLSIEILFEAWTHRNMRPQVQKITALSWAPIFFFLHCWNISTLTWLSTWTMWWWICCFEPSTMSQSPESSPQFPFFYGRTASVFLERNPSGLRLGSVVSMVSLQYYLKRKKDILRKGGCCCETESMKFAEQKSNCPW